MAAVLDLREPFRRTAPSRSAPGTGCTTSSFFLSGFVYALRPALQSVVRSRTPRASPAYRLFRRKFHVSSAPRITPALGAGEMHAPHACAYPAKRLIEACAPFGRPLAPAPPPLRAPLPPKCSCLTHRLRPATCSHLKRRRIGNRQ